MNDKGVTTGEVQAHLAEIYGVQVSRDTISTITDRVLDSLAEFRFRTDRGDGPAQGCHHGPFGIMTFIYCCGACRPDATLAR